MSSVRQDEFRRGLEWAKSVLGDPATVAVAASGMSNKDIAEIDAALNRTRRDDIAPDPVECQPTLARPPIIKGKRVFPVLEDEPVRLSSALRFVPLEWRFVLLACAGAVLVLAAGVYTGLQLHAPTITRTVHVTPVAAVGAMSGSALVAALGQPSKSQTNGGVTCNLYADKQIEVCFKA